MKVYWSLPHAVKTSLVVHKNKPPLILAMGVSPSLAAKDVLECLQLALTIAYIPFTILMITYVLAAGGNISRARMYSALRLCEIDSQMHVQDMRGKA